MTKYFVKICFVLDDRAAVEITKHRLSPDDFNMVKVIGRGAFGEVQVVGILYCHSSHRTTRVSYQRTQFSDSLFNAAAY